MKLSLSKAMVLITIIFMDLLTGMEFDLFVPSFPELQVQFGLTPFWVEALLSVNFIGYCLSLFFVGILADHYGRKPIIILGMLVFVVGSILCVAVSSYPFVLVGRFLQGVGIAAPSILSFLIIADTYPIKQQQFLLAMLNVVMNLAAGLAPVLGSYITLYFHWQGNFTALLGLGVWVLGMVLLFIPKYQLPKQKEKFSLRAYFPVFRSKPLLLVIMHIIFMITPYWIFVGISPLLYMKDLGVSLQYFGYYQGALAATFAIGCLCYGLVIKKTDQKTMLWLSAWALVASAIVLAVVAGEDIASPLWITVVFLPYIIAGVIPSTLLFPLALNFKPEAKGRVAAIIQGGRLALSAVGLQIAAYFYIGSFQNVGWITLTFIIIATLLLFKVITHRALMGFLERNEKP